MRLLIERGADINARNQVRHVRAVSRKDGDTPLHAACWYDHDAIVRVLLEHDVDKSLRNNASRARESDPAERSARRRPWR